MRFLNINHGMVILVSICLCSTAASGVEFNELTRYLPDGANAIVTLNVEKTLESELAQAEKWGQPDVGGQAPLKMPPKAKRFVIATQLDFEYMRPLWEVAVFELGIDPSMDFIAGRTHGTPDKLGAVDAVETPKDSIIVKFAPNVFAAMRPASRQRASRWVRGTTSGQVSLSPYLAKAAGYPDRVGTDIIMAFDLQDVLRQTDVRNALEGSQVLKGKTADKDAIAESMASIQGITLGVLVGKRAHGKLKIDFAKDTAPMAAVAKPLLLEALGEAGATIGEFHDWKVGVTSRQITLDGDITRSGLLRLFSLFELDSSDVHQKEQVAASSSDGGETPNNEDIIPYASKKYYDAVDKYLVDLSREKGANSFGQIGLWFQKYARKIDALPILNVDKDLVDYGAWTAERLRDATASIQGVGIRSSAQESQVYNTNSGSASYSTYGRPVRYGAYGGYRVYGGGSGYAEWDVRNVQAERRAIRGKERAKGSSEARAIVKEVNNESSKIRREMTERYQMEF